MNFPVPPVLSTDARAGVGRWRDAEIAAVLLAVVAGFLAITGDSLWIDEAHCAVAAKAAGFAEWRVRLLEVPSDVQMWGYFFQLWVWEKLAGASEWALRLNNYGWYLTSLVVWLAAVPRKGRVWMALLIGLSPFLWYYLNETRPYLMVFCGMSLMTASLMHGALSRFSRGWFWIFGCGGLVAVAASSSTIPWVGINGLALLFLWARQTPRVAFPWDAVGGLALPGAAILALSFWSFLQGARATSPEPSSLASLLFVPYELLGFAGIGPGRAELRTGDLASLKPFLLLTGALTCALAVVTAAGIAALRNRVGWRRLFGAAALYALPVAAVVGIGFYSGLRTTGRHFTPALALILPVLATGLHTLWNTRRHRARIAAVVLLLAWGMSCAGLRISASHKKENYREAARIAREAVETGREVWWLADPAGAEYYGLELREGGRSEKAGHDAARRIVNPEHLPAPLPDLVVYGRRDVYDNQAVVAKMLAAGYRPTRELQGFSLWEKQ